MKLDKEKSWIIGSGLLIGLVAVILTLCGNPKNMGFCIACFLRDTAGGLHLHTAAVVEYIRPEVIGIVLGSFVLSILTKNFRACGGSAPVTRFVLGFMVMIGALVFLGCPFRLILRLAGGDANAIIGLIGFIAGIGIGCIFLANGFSLGRSKTEKSSEGVVFPSLTILLLIVFLAFPSLFLFSEKGPGSMHAPIALSLAMGLLVGAIAERTRFCMVGGIRDSILIKDFTLLLGFVGVFAGALILNIATKNFHFGFANQPIAHSQHIWNFLGMVVVGLGSALLGGCPLRQLVMAGEGSSDSAVAVFGMIIGAAFAHNFGLASAAQSATSAGGPPIKGKVAVILCIIILLAIGSVNTFLKKGENR